MKRIFTLLLFFGLFSFPGIAKATCSYKEQVRLKQLASNVNFSYRSIETRTSVHFQITVSNLTNEIYMVEKSTSQRYYANNQDLVLDNYETGKTIRFDFYAKDSSCVEGVLFTNYVILPDYNPYYDDRICEGIEKSSLCQKWLKHKMTWEEFSSSVFKYKESLQQEKIKEEQVEGKKEKKVDWNKVIDFWGKYYIYILVIIIAVTLVIMYLYDKKTDIS